MIMLDNSQKDVTQSQAGGTRICHPKPGTVACNHQHGAMDSCCYLSWTAASQVECVSVLSGVKPRSKSKSESAAAWLEGIKKLIKLRARK